MLCLVRGLSSDEVPTLLLAVRPCYVAFLLTICFQAEWNERLEVVSADVSALAADSPLFLDLAQRVDAIYHSAALVNWVLPYAQMRAPNVLGTLALLQLAYSVCFCALLLLYYFSRPLL